ncbi:PstS family phosphate ABC transporter substrate-binding protein [Massilia cavernae]|uniref:Phosphate ABC transporter substrate-binding protein, PhoT family n=1 Tax=Massilia cavernae TaxID=2320864 RepID=A0A418XFP4_9BURK|nr:substrate-binding domain-containing protein [Massilia cavernae]RJG11280.1 phosphate ABC transporter substrate-binding protein, PhoT family [Massilia cavernae]
MNKSTTRFARAQRRHARRDSAPLLRASVAACLALAAGACAASADPAKPLAPLAPNQMLQMVYPAPATTVPQTPEQTEASRRTGRKAPTPEVLQPTLDSALPSYRPRTDIKLSGTFKGGASDVLPGVVGLWFKRFQKMYPNVKMSIIPPFAGSLGAKELVKQNVDFVFVSRELKPEDLVEFKAKFGYDPLSVPISGGSYRHFGFLDAVGFFVHKDNPLEKITFEQLDAIYSSTRHRGGAAITTWGQLGLGGEWADKPIHAYGIKPWNGFEEFVRQRVLSSDGKRGEWNDKVTFEKVVFPMARHGAEDRYSIGYTGMAYLDAGVKLIPVGETAAGPFDAPTYESVALATYPLSRLIYFNLNKTPGKPLNPVLEEFIKYMLSKEGQQAVLDHAIYVPLRSGQAEGARALLAK